MEGVRSEPPAGHDGGYCRYAIQPYTTICRLVYRALRTDRRRHHQLAQQITSLVTVHIAKALNDKRPVAPIDLTEKMTAPLIGLFGNDDENPNADQVNRTEAVLKKLGKNYEFHRYDGAGHAFFNYSRGPAYRAEAAADGWKKVFAFLNKNLAA